MADEKKPDFSFETVAVLCASILASGGSIGGKSYDMMSALDGKRTANSFQHQFRNVLKRARELKEQMDSEEGIKGVEAKPRATTKAPRTPKAPKTPKAKSSGGKTGRDSGKTTEDDEDAADAGGERDSKRTKHDFDFPDVKEEEQ
ncbi:Hypothetical protein D9617_10g073020 [Elsinoe fawcettii]|nr:Hypothetical protein D9617_10g073020 [Elsinoe fawcettii]